MKTLVIVDHPFFDRSVVNRRWLDEVRRYPEDIQVHNLQSSYPHSSIDPVKEHSLLDNADGVVLEFPMFWYNCPSTLKSWFDCVFSPGWAYGGGHHLEGKPFGIAVTTGSPAEAYTPEGAKGHTIEEFLNSLIMSLRHVKADFKGIYSFCGASQPDGSRPNPILLADSARGYVDFIFSLTGKTPAKA